MLCCCGCVCVWIFWIFVLVVCGERVSRNDVVTDEKTNEWLRGCVWVREDIILGGCVDYKKNDFVVIVCVIQDCDFFLVVKRLL